MTGELTWDHAVHDIPDSGISTTRHATPQELEAIARALQLVACSSLTSTYTIMPIGDRHYRLSGRLQASLQQACVVTLEPVQEAIEETFEVTFWPQAEIPSLPAARSRSTTSRRSGLSCPVRSRPGGSYSNASREPSIRFHEGRRGARACGREPSR